MIRAALLACCTAAVRINCTVAVPRRIRAGDRVAARVDVAVAAAAAESLVIELRSSGPVTFGPGAPGLDPPGDAGDDDVIYAARGGGVPCGHSSPLNGQIPRRRDGQTTRSAQRA